MSWFKGIVPITSLRMSPNPIPGIKLSNVSRPFTVKPRVSESPSYSVWPSIYPTKPPVIPTYAGVSVRVGSGMSAAFSTLAPSTVQRLTLTSPTIRPANAPVANVVESALRRSSSFVTLWVTLPKAPLTFVPSIASTAPPRIPSKPPSSPPRIPPTRPPSPLTSVSVLLVHTDSLVTETLLR